MWIVIVLACLLALFILLLSIPLDIGLRIVAHDNVVASWKITWLYGLLRRELRGGERKPRKQRPKASEKKSRRDKRGSAGEFVKLALNRKLWGQVFALIKRLLSRIAFRRLDVNLKIGLDDPGNSWLIAALAIWATIFFHPPCLHSINIQPRFTDEFIVNGVIYSEARVIPLLLFLSLLQFVFSMPVLRAMKKVVSARWKKKA